MLKMIVRSRIWPLVVLVLGCLPLMGLECDQGPQLHPLVLVRATLAPAEPQIGETFTVDANKSLVSVEVVSAMEYRIDAVPGSSAKAPVFWRRDAVDYPAVPLPLVTTSLPVGRYTLSVSAHFEDQFRTAMASSLSIPFWVSDCGPAPYLGEAPPSEVDSDSDFWAEGKMPYATVGQPYDEAIPVSGGVDPLVFSKSPVGNELWPDWVAVTPDGRLVSDEVMDVSGGTYLNIDVADACFGGARTVRLNLHLPRLDASCGPPPVVQGFETPVMLRGYPYENHVLVADGKPPFRISPTPEFPFPPDLGMTYSGDRIAGRPDMSGVFEFPLRVVDDCLRSAVGTVTLTVMEPACEYLFVPDSVTRAVDVGEPVDHALVDGGYPPLTIALTSGELPPGLTIDAVGVISGAPTTPGSYAAEYDVSDSCPEGIQQGVVTAYYEVNDPNPSCPPLAFTGEELPPGLSGSPYSAFIGTSGGEPPLHFEELDAMPPGLSLDHDTGEVSGTVSASGGYTFTVLVYDSCTPEVQQVTRGFSIGFE